MTSRKEENGALPKTSRFVTVSEICTDLQIARSTWDDWMAKGKVPPYHRLPNGRLRIKRQDYEDWLETLMDGAA